MKLTPQQRQEIELAVERAEAKTSGEIATALIAESDSYAAFELGYALIVGGAVFMLELLFHTQLTSLVQAFFWGDGTFTLVLFFGGVPLLSILGAYSLFNLPLFDRLIVPAPLMHQKVNQRAARHFLEAGLD